MLLRVGVGPVPAPSTALSDRPELGRVCPGVFWRLQAHAAWE